MEYLAWRVWSGLHNEIELSFMIVGHTKFSPDWAFGLFKRAFKRTKVSCLNDIARVCEASAYVNFAQLVGTQDGSVIVPMYDWSGFFQPFFKADPFSGLKKLYHLRFTSENVGVCFVRETSDGTERKLYVLRKEYTQWRPPKTVLHRRMIPEGLSLERKTYLFEKIRNFALLSARILCVQNQEFRFHHQIIHPLCLSFLLLTLLFLLNFTHYLPHLFPWLPGLHLQKDQEVDQGKILQLLTWLKSKLHQQVQT